MIYESNGPARLTKWLKLILWLVIGDPLISSRAMPPLWRTGVLIKELLVNIPRSCNTAREYGYIRIWQPHSKWGSNGLPHLDFFVATTVALQACVPCCPLRGKRILKRKQIKEGRNPTRNTLFVCNAILGDPPLFGIAGGTYTLRVHLEYRELPPHLHRDSQTNLQSFLSRPNRQVLREHKYTIRRKLPQIHYQVQVRSYYQNICKREGDIYRKRRKKIRQGLRRSTETLSIWKGDGGISLSFHPPGSPPLRTLRNE